MKQKLPISVTIITRNEEARLRDAILSVSSFASEIVVVDSESTDKTVDIARELGAKVFRKPFIGFGQQKNFAQDQVQEEWILNIDADERVTPKLENELRTFFLSGQDARCAGGFVPRKTWYLNRWIMHGGWYPNYLLRFSRKDSGRWTEPNLHEALKVKGECFQFQAPLEHYSFPNQRSHILKNLEYAAMAERTLKDSGKTSGIFDIIVRPVYKFFDMYLIKRGFLDGVSGFLIAVHSAYAMFLRYAYLYEETKCKNHSKY
jgi:glycosyltransferase involved in cell wall biosynthesis